MRNSQYQAHKEKPNDDYQTEKVTAAEITNVHTAAPAIIHLLAYFVQTNQPIVKRCN